MSEGILPVTGNNSNTINSNSGSNNNLPRGLMSKSGLPFNPNQRLPSLRSSLSKPSLLFQSSASFTHNQIITSSSSPIIKSLITSKRTYEPNIGSGDCMVTTRRQTGEVKGFNGNSVKQNQGKNGLDSWRRGGGGGSTSSTSSTGRGRRQNVKKSKKLIQLESNVFTGAARSPIKKDADSNRKSKSKIKTPISSLPLLIEDQSEDSIEPAYIEGKLYQDDFIDRSDKDDNCEHLPQGWENLSLPNVKELENFSTTREHWLTPDPLRDKLILFQLPKMLENQTNMKLGKLRIYESGKVELLNNPSDLIFEVTKAGKSSSEPIIKPVTSSSSILSSSSPPPPPTTTSTTSTTPTAITQSTASTSFGDDFNNAQLVSKKNYDSIKLDYVEPRLNREVVIYSGRNLISVGKLESDAAIVIPKLFNNS